MDFQRVIESTRQNVKRAQASYSAENYRVDRIKKPLMMYVIMDRRFDPQFRDQRILLQRGVVVWGSIIQANQILFDPNGSHASLPAASHVCSQQSLRCQSRLVDRSGTQHVRFKGSGVYSRYAGLRGQVGQRDGRRHPIAHPHGLYRWTPVLLRDLDDRAKHLPGNYLANGFFPVLIAPKETETVMVLPETYWDPQFRRAWES